MIEKKLKVLSTDEYLLIESKEPYGIYDRHMRERLYWIIEKLRTSPRRPSRPERKIYKKFRYANFGLLMQRDSSSEGTLNYKGDVCIEGNFEGEIISPKMLIVEKTGKVKADITAETVICKGKIKGNIISTERVEIHAHAMVWGTIETPSLHIEDGAKFKGTCRMELNPQKDLHNTTAKIIKFFKAG
ncbi:MAG: polymer-forming cytoskeletal protein [Nitrospinales bacterium]